MGQQLAKKKPILGINRDISFKDLSDNQARFMQNFERTINTTPSGIGGNSGALTPVPANRQVQIPALNLPGYTGIRAFESKLTNEMYVWAFNSQGAHTIYRVNQDLTTEVIYQGADLDLSDNPIHAVRGAHLFYIQGRKYLLWVDGRKWQGFLDVETSIATQSFRVPYFQLGEFEQEQYWQLVTRPPMHCISAEWIDIDPANKAELDMVNYMMDKTYQFRQKYIYTDGRESEWGPISTSFYIERSEDQQDARGLPRCLSLRFGAGHPQVEKIVLAYRNCNGNAFDETNPFDFQEFKRFNKYEECLDPNTPFWERGIREDEEDDSLVYDPDTNDFILKFCGEGKCDHIDVTETNRTQNPAPITSYALGVVENCLLLLNNISGYNQVDCHLSDKFKINLVNPSPTACKVQYAEVKVAVIIHNIHRQVNQPIFTYGNDAAKEQKFFGGLMYRKLSTPFDDPGPYLQYFSELQAGFIVYPEGTKNYCITKQWKDGVEYGAENDFDTGSKRRDVSRFLDDGKYYVQYGTIKVIKGSKGYLRLSGHRTQPGDAYRDTSTTVIGILRNLTGYSAKQNIFDDNRTDLYSREIWFDTCNGNVDVSNTPFVVADLTAPFGDLTNPYTATAVTGYISDRNKNKVPQAQIEHLGYARGGSYDSLFTDHNGFYFASWAMNDVAVGAETLGIKVYVEGDSCTKVVGKEARILQGGGSMPNITNERDYEIDQINNYENSNFATVRIRVEDCRGAAIPGVPFVMKGYKAVNTNSSGLASLVIRNRMYAYNVAFAERAVLMQAGSGYTICDTNCSTCMPDFNVALPACFSTEPVIDIKDSFNQNRIVNLDPFFSSQRGMKPGGRYNFAPIFHDASGRHTWVPDEDLIVSYPTVQQMRAFGFATTNWQILGPLNLPPEFRYMSWVRTANTAFTFLGQWVADKVTYVDASGNETASTNADKIRLSIQSLIERNVQQISANTTYQWVDGDRLLVIASDTGDLFAEGNGPLDFLIEGAVTIKIEKTETEAERQSYELIIRNDSRLSTLKEGALLEFIRPNECLTTQPYFEICDMIDIVDGEPVQTSGTFPSFDTYQIRRSIQWDDINHIFPFAFEHHSPSDFWGNRCDDRGRIFYKNPWAKQIHEGQSAYLSDAILENGNRNGLSTFRGERVKTFKSNTRGDITAAYSMDRAVKILCERGNFTAVIGDGFIRTGRDGIARASNADEFLVEPNQTVSKFGLQYEDPLAWIFGNGWGMWADTYNKAIVFDDFNNPTDVTAGRIQGDYATKLQYRENYNKNKTGFNRIRLCMGYDPVSKNGYLTFWAKNWGDGFIADRADIAFDKNETYGISLLDQSIFNWSFTPECFGCLHASTKGEVFFSMRNGVPWVHREKGYARWNEFFGTPVDQRMILVLNNEPDIIKLFIAMQQQSPLQKYWVDRVTTVGTDSRTQTLYNMVSEIPPAAFELRESKFCGSFLFNKLTPNKVNPLWNGEALRGEYAVISFVRDNSLNDSVTVKDDSKRIRYSELDSIFFIYAHSANSAYQTG